MEPWTSENEINLKGTTSCIVCTWASNHLFIVKDTRNTKFWLSSRYILFRESLIVKWLLWIYADSSVNTTDNSNQVVNLFKWTSGLAKRIDACKVNNKQTLILYLEESSLMSFLRYLVVVSIGDNIYLVRFECSFQPIFHSRTQSLIVHTNLGPLFMYLAYNIILLELGKNLTIIGFYRNDLLWKTECFYWSMINVTTWSDSNPVQWNLKKKNGLKFAIKPGKTCFTLLYVYTKIGYKKVHSW